MGAYGSRAEPAAFDSRGLRLALLVIALVVPFSYFRSTAFAVELGLVPQVRNSGSFEIVEQAGKPSNAVELLVCNFGSTNCRLFAMSPSCGYECMQIPTVIPARQTVRIPMVLRLKAKIEKQEFSGLIWLGIDGEMHRMPWRATYHLPQQD